MKQEFTHEYMQANCGCYSRKHLMAQTFMKSDPVLLRDILESDIPLKHKFWFVCHKLATKRQNQEIAIGCAELVLDIYEAKYPENKSSREAIQAAKDFINDTITMETLLEKKRAVYAAAVADAAAAVYADAADDAVYAAAADDAAAASYADYAAAGYADADAYKEKLLTLLISITQQS